MNKQTRQDYSKRLLDLEKEIRADELRNVIYTLEKMSKQIDKLLYSSVALEILTESTPSRFIELAKKRSPLQIRHRTLKKILNILHEQRGRLLFEKR